MLLPVSTWRWQAVALAAVFALQASLALTLGGHPLLQAVGDLDPGVYWRLAQRVAGGDVLLTGTPFFVSPLYIYWLALAQVLTDARVTGVLLLQAGLGTIAVWLAARTAALWVPREDRAPAAISAGAALALTGIITLQQALILQSSLDALLMSWFAYASSRALLAQSARTWTACGASLALLAANRPNAWLLALPVVIGAMRRSLPTSSIGSTEGATRDRVWAVTRTRATHLVALAAGIAVVLAPLALRTRMATGGSEVLPGHGGLNFYIGNHPQANGTYTVVDGIRPTIEGQISDAQGVVLREDGRHVRPTHVSAYFTRRALAWWRDAPLAAARLFLYKLWLTTHAWELPVNASYAWFREQVWLLWLLPVGAWLLVPVGLAVCVGLHPARRANTTAADRSAGGRTQHAEGGEQTAGGGAAAAGVAAGLRPPAEADDVAAAWRLFRWLLPMYLASVALFFVVDRYRAPALVLGAIHLGVLGSTWRPLSARGAQALVTSLTRSGEGWRR